MAHSSYFSTAFELFLRVFFLSFFFFCRSAKAYLARGEKRRRRRRRNGSGIPSANILLIFSLDKPKGIYSLKSTIISSWYLNIAIPSLLSRCVTSMIETRGRAIPSTAETDGKVRRFGKLRLILSPKRRADTSRVSYAPYQTTPEYLWNERTDLD